MDERVRRPQGLTPKQAAFVAEYGTDLNGTQAAIRAGYSRHTAESQACRLLTKVKVRRAIVERAKERGEKVGLNAELFVERLRRPLAADIGSLFDARGNLRPIRDLSPEEASLIASCDVVREGGRDRIVRLRLVDRSRYLELAGRYLGLFKPLQVKVGPSSDLVAALQAARHRMAAMEAEVLPSTDPGK